MDPAWYPGWTQVRLAAPGARFSVSSMDSGVDSSLPLWTQVWTQVRLAAPGGRFSVFRGAQERFGYTWWAFPRPELEGSGPPPDWCRPSCGHSVGHFFTSIKTL